MRCSENKYMPGDKAGPIPLKVRARFTLYNKALRRTVTLFYPHNKTMIVSGNVTLNIAAIYR